MTEGHVYRTPAPENAAPELPEKLRAHPCAPCRFAFVAWHVHITLKTPHLLCARFPPDAGPTDWREGYPKPSRRCGEFAETE